MTIRLHELATKFRRRRRQLNGTLNSCRGGARLSDSPPYAVLRNLLIISGASCFCQVLQWP